MAIIGIVAVGKNLAIGKDGKLPWHYSADLKFFKRTTTGNAVLMGANTWRSIGKRLPRRLNIILSRTLEIEGQPGVSVVRSKEEAIELHSYLRCDLFVIGGAKTYESFADIIDQWVVTEIPMQVENADVFMPDDYLEGFEEKEAQVIDNNLTVRKFERAD